MDDSYRDIYAATFGATFARLVIDRSFEGFDPPDAYKARKLAEEADSVAHMAVEALDAYLREKIEKVRAAEARREQRVCQDSSHAWDTSGPDGSPYCRTCGTLAGFEDERQIDEMDG